LKRSSRRVIGGLILAACLIAAFWVLWWTDRRLLATRTTASYYAFEGSFALADGWLLVCICAAALQLARRRASALLWLIAAGAAGIYLLCMDLLYDLEHGIYGSGRGGVIELVIDVLVAGASLGALAWSWHNRLALLALRD
jgi:hypothetical protein